MSMWTGMGPDQPSPKLDPNCQCVCHTQPGVLHVAACCATPTALATSPEVRALIREAEARGMERAAVICESIRICIANGPMPEGARFDYEQTIRAEAATIRGEKP